MITGAADGGDVTIIDAVPVDPINVCPVCTQPGVKRDHVIRELVDLPVVGFPTRLRVRLPRYLCSNQGCQRRIFQAGLDCAFDGEKTTRRVTRWILQRLAIDCDVSACGSESAAYRVGFVLPAGVGSST
ncbi:transposase family protein [Corynebacterium glucuronolyticum]|nr:transposase family protein [Corynebacterium glucuronolyticum]